jgi:hypothetical protein
LGGNTVSVDNPQDRTGMSEEAPIQPYTWQVQVWQRDPAKLYGILLACVIAALAGWFLFHQVGFSVLGFAAIAGATAEYWTPQKYKLDRNGATARCGISVTAITWSDVNEIFPDAGGVKLSPLSQESRLSPFRGVYLRFSDNREEVLERIEHSRSGNV